MADLILQSGLEVTKKGVTIKVSGLLMNDCPETGDYPAVVSFEISKYDIERLAKLAGVIK